MTEVKKEIEELKQPIFQSLSADNPETTTIESLCVNCGKNVCIVYVYIYFFSI